MIFGRNPVLEYIKRASKDSGSVLHVQKNAHGKIISTITDEAKKKNMRIVFEEKTFFTSRFSSATHQGVALETASGSSSKADMGEKELLAAAKEKKGVLVFLDRITDPHNAGSIIRSAEALGAVGVVLPKSNSVDITPTVIKSSAGATAHIDIVRVSNPARFLEDAKDEGFWIIGTSDHGTADIKSLRNLKPAVIVIGSEGSGMKKLTEEKCDTLVRIPLKGQVSSLNASVAAGIILFEILDFEE